MRTVALQNGDASPVRLLVPDRVLGVVAPTIVCGHGVPRLVSVGLDQAITTPAVLFTRLEVFADECFVLRVDKDGIGERKGVGDGADVGDRPRSHVGSEGEGEGNEREEGEEAHDGKRLRFS